MRRGEGREGKEHQPDAKQPSGPSAASGNKNTIQHWQTSLDTLQSRSHWGGLPRLGHDPAGQTYGESLDGALCSPVFLQSHAFPCGSPSRDTDHRTNRIVTFVVVFLKLFLLKTATYGCVSLIFWGEREGN